MPIGIVPDVRRSHNSRACCCVGAAASQTILSMSTSSLMRSRRKIIDARSDAPHDTPVLRPPFAVASSCASRWRRLMIEKAVALDIGWPSSSPPCGASSRKSFRVFRASCRMSPFGPAQDVSTAVIIWTRVSSSGIRAPVCLPQIMCRTIDSGITSMSASTSRFRACCCLASSVANVACTGLLRGSRIMSARVAVPRSLELVSELRPFRRCWLCTWPLPSAGRVSKMLSTLSRGVLTLCSTEGTEELAAAT
eukprot:4356297-Pleurochrysis_carterae.AAC.1